MVLFSRRVWLRYPTYWLLHPLSMSVLKILNRPHAGGKGEFILLTQRA
jgi:hypothetical protein